ncbi:MAG: hypothetical protein NT051_04785, partial [Candidatus Micrarchaeota archaeon]|nr:hypothetical protein [Candidatus Micrarchaeota archaeon]
ANASRMATAYIDVPGGFVKHNISEILLMPGEEACFGSSPYSSGGQSYPGNCPEHMVRSIPINRADLYCVNNYYPCIVTTECPLGPSTGYMVAKTLSFNYTVYVDDQEMTKTQIGEKDFIVKCIGAV